MKPWIRLIILAIIFLLYLCGGAFLFNILETSQEGRLYREAQVFYNQFMENHDCVSHEEFLHITEEVLSKYNNIHWDIVNNQSEWKSSFKWTLSNSVFFSATVITTIGYGNLSPVSYLSRISVLPFAIIGIPLTGMLLGAIGQCLETQWKSLAHRLYDVLGIIKSPTHRKLWCVMIMVAFTYILVFVLPAVVFVFTEGWNWFDAHYYTFISLSTIGFGDYVAGSRSNSRHLGGIIYRLCIIAYIVTGLSVLTILFRVVQEYQEKQVGKVKSLKRNMTTKLLHKQKQSDFMESSNNVVENNGISLLKVSFNHINTICSSTYKLDSSGTGYTVDIATQTDEKDYLLQEYRTRIISLGPWQGPYIT